MVIVAKVSNAGHSGCDVERLPLVVIGEQKTLANSPAIDSGSLRRVPLKVICWI